MVKMHQRHHIPQQMGCAMGYAASLRVCDFDFSVRPRPGRTSGGLRVQWSLSREFCAFNVVVLGA